MSVDNKPLVSVVSVVFDLVRNRRVGYFGQMVESVLAQTYDNVEHIVIDGGSKDGTVEILEEYAKQGKIRYVSEPDDGIYDAMNKGARLAKGELVTFLNSDDFFCDSKAIEKSIEALGQNFAYSYAKILNLDEASGKKNIGKIKWFRALRNMPFPHPGMVIRKAVFDKLNGFDPQFRLVGDYDLIMRLLLAGYEGKEVKGVLVAFRLGGATDQNKHKHKDEMKKVYYKNYAPIAGLSEKECEVMVDTYIFPSKLLKKLILGNYASKIKASAIWLWLNGLKRKLKKLIG